MSENVMSDMMKSYLAGLVIGIGCIANMAVGRGVLGAFLFSIGLLLILTKEYKLYTGVVPYATFDFDSITYVIFVWCWNVLGGMTAAVIGMFARPDLVEVAKTISVAKMKESWRIVLLSILCNFMIYFAVESYRKIKHQVGKYLMVILCVMIFVLCGFEHSIANVTYLLMGCDAVGVLGFWQILFSCTIGNAVGGILIHNLDKNAEGA